VVWPTDAPYVPIAEIIVLPFGLEGRTLHFVDKNIFLVHQKQPSGSRSIGTAAREYRLLSQIAKPLHDSTSWGA
jgi:hypothetical protein